MSAHFASNTSSPWAISLDFSHYGLSLFMCLWSFNSHFKSGGKARVGMKDTPAKHGSIPNDESSTIA